MPLSYSPIWDLCEPQKKLCRTWNPIWGWLEGYTLVESYGIKRPKIFGFDKSGNIFMHKKEIAPDVSNPGKLVTASCSIRRPPEKKENERKRSQSSWHLLRSGTRKAHLFAGADQDPWRCVIGAYNSVWAQAAHGQAGIAPLLPMTSQEKQYSWGVFCPKCPVGLLRAQSVERVSCIAWTGSWGAAAMSARSIVGNSPHQLHIEFSWVINEGKGLGIELTLTVRLFLALAFFLRLEPSYRM